MEINSMFYIICEQAAINAASSLSKFTGNVVKLNFNEFNIKSLKDPTVLEKNNEFCIYTPINGDLEGFVLFSMAKQHAEELWNNLKIYKLEQKDISEYLHSFMTETMNIVVGNFLTNLALYLNLTTIKHHMTLLQESSYHDILNKGISLYKPKDLLIKIKYYFPLIKINCEFLYVLTRSKIKSALENNYLLEEIGSQNCM